MGSPLVLRAVFTTYCARGIRCDFALYFVAGKLRGFFVALSLPSPPCKMAQSTKRAAALIRENAQGGNNWADVLGNVGVP